MDTDYDKYLKDKRISCKYGTKCYQKNPAHHERYKHPPVKKAENRQRPSVKKFKAENRVIASKNASDSEEEESKEQSDSDSNSSSTCSTKIETQKVNNDVSDSDSEAVQSDANDVEEYNRGSLADSDQKNEESSPSLLKNDVVGDKENTSNSLQLDKINFIKQKFLVTMPDDFYQFYDFCKQLKPDTPLEALKDVGLYLVGPFDVLAGKFLNVIKSPSEYLIHWRYYRDPPELQTVLKSDDPSGYHIGYFRDSADELPVFLVSNSSKKNGILIQMGENIFSSVNIFLDELKKSGNPFKKIAIGKIQAALTRQAEKLGIDLSKKTKKMIAREKKIVTRTFNKIGLVVPLDKKTEVGYRPLALDNKVLESCLTKLQNSNTKQEKEACLSDLQPVFTYTSIATDECDFGTGIELGWNIISHGIDSLNATAERFLVSNYKLLNRDSFAKIAEVHMKNRRQGLNLSIL